MKNKLSRMALAFISLVLAAAAFAADPPGKSGGATAPRTEGADKALSQAALDAGLRSCKPLTDQVTRYLIGSNPSSGLLWAAPENANARIASASVEVESEQGVTYASANYAPYGEAGCGVAFDAVTYWKSSCAEVASKMLRALKPIGHLGRKIAMLDGGPQMRMYLMPAGAGCVQIKKEILY